MSLHFEGFLIAETFVTSCLHPFENGDYSKSKFFPLRLDPTCEQRQKWEKKQSCFSIHLKSGLHWYFATDTQPKITSCSAATTNLPASYVKTN